MLQSGLKPDAAREKFLHHGLLDLPGFKDFSSDFRDFSLHA
jgi:hypothetical protein